MAREISTSDVMGYLTATGRQQRMLHEKASDERNKSVSASVYFRGLIEFSNVCSNDCLYCGIRRSNREVKRYSMTKKEILDTVAWCDKVDYGSIVLQSGEVRTREFTSFVVDVLETIKEKFPDIGITLCVGEQKKKTYEEFFEAGAHRYLLRIETTNGKHYGKLHPKEMSFRNRKKCLENLKDIGFQVGTGVMVGSNFQTLENLADDLLFFREFDVDMVGMGPYVPHSQTPLKADDYNESRNLNLSLNMIAVLRLTMPDINIAATTALQALHPYGRELGLLAGANVIMPIVTPKIYRESYKLYENKPCVDESSEDCLECIVSRIKSTGLKPAFGEWGDSKHFFRRRKNDC